MTPSELAAELRVDPKSLRAWLRRGWPRFEPGARWDLTPEQVDAARQRWRSGVDASDPGPAAPEVARRQTSVGRVDSDESYVLNLLDELLGAPGHRQATFPWLLGDPSGSGTCRALPVDGYWAPLGLVVEYRERQHDEPVAFFDKPDRLTVSGVHRGEQRRLYDDRRDREIPAHGLRLLVIRPSDLSSDGRGRLRRQADDDRAALQGLLSSTPL